MKQLQGLSQKQIQNILKIIKSTLPHTKIYAFGSRVTGKARKYSDLDLALDNGKDIELSRLMELKERLSETDIPFVIDLIDYQSISLAFKKIIDRDKKKL